MIKELMSVNDLKWLVRYGYVKEKNSCYVLADDSNVVYCTLFKSEEGYDCMFDALIHEDRHKVNVDDSWNPVDKESGYYIPGWCFVDYWMRRGVLPGDISSGLLMETVNEHISAIVRAITCYTAQKGTVYFKGNLRQFVDDGEQYRWMRFLRLFYDERNMCAAVVVDEGYGCEGGGESEEYIFELNELSVDEMYFMLNDMEDSDDKGESHCSEDI